MKHIWLFLAVVCLSLLVSFALGNAYAATKEVGYESDSLINVLANGQGAPELVYKTNWAFGAERAFGEGGSAAGGMREAQDTLLNYIDPSNAPREAVPPAATGGMRDAPDSLIHQISPAN